MLVDMDRGKNVVFDEPSLMAIASSICNPSMA